MLRLLLAIALTLVSLSPAFPKDTGEWKDASPELRDWFKSVRSPNGIPCCDIADGHRATYRAAQSGFEVLIEGEWHQVPPEAVVRQKENPTGEGIVWYGHQNGKPFIRCFIPAAEG